MSRGLLVAVFVSLAGASAAPSSLARTETPIVLSPAPADTVREIHAALDRARTRLEARDIPGVLGYVSDQYRSGIWTKPEVQRQLLGILQLCDSVRARVSIDSVQVADRGGVWVFTTGEISGRLALVGSWVTLLTWEKEPEVARREGTSWRLFGFQQ